MYKTIISFLLISAVILPGVNSFAKNNDLKLQGKNQKIINEVGLIQNLTQRKEKIKKLSKETNDIELKRVLETNVVTDVEKSIVKEKTLSYSKYTNNPKNYQCWDGTGFEAGKALAGNTLWRFNTRVTACADNSKVYSGSVRSMGRGISAWMDIYRGNSR